MSLTSVIFNMLYNKLNFRDTHMTSQQIGKKTLFVL